VSVRRRPSLTPPADTLLVLDSGGVIALARRDDQARALLAELADCGLWPARVPSAVLVEWLTRLLKECYINEMLDVVLARRAAKLRTAARTGSAVDAVVVASAEPAGTVLTSDYKDIRALASQTSGAVKVFRL
jgi:hypothetical protein